MKRCAECEEIKFGFAGFDIKENEQDEWVWICDSNECVQAWIGKAGVVTSGKAEKE